MFPFDSYPSQGRVLLGPVSGDRCRRGYGLKFMQKTGQTACAYCGVDFAASYQDWLNMTLDHVVPVNVCRDLRISDDWMEDCANKVLACSACNGFNNRYKPSEDIAIPQSLAGFFDLRDRIFTERKRLVTASHEREREFFARRLWQL